MGLRRVGRRSRRLHRTRLLMAILAVASLSASGLSPLTSVADASGQPNPEGVLPTPIASLMDASDPGAPVPLLRSYLGDRVGGQWPSPTMASLFVGVKGLSSADHQFLASLGPEASSTVYLVPVLFGERDLLGFAEVLATVLERFRPLGLFRDSEIRLAYESNVVEVSFSTANDLVLNALRAAVPQAALSLLTLPGTAPKQRNASRVTLP